MKKIIIIIGIALLTGCASKKEVIRAYPGEEIYLKPGHYEIIVIDKGED
jgi:uncharacterized lipoprotein YajG